MKSISILITTLALALPLAAQNAAPTASTRPGFGEKVDVNYVLIDATVTDRTGHQILGLGKDDFIIKENGTQQSVESVDYYTSRQLLNASEAKADFKVERVHDERYFVIFFDRPQDGRLFDRLSLARRAAERWIDSSMQPNDRVAIVGHNVRLDVFSDFTSNKQQLRRALAEAMTFSHGLSAFDAGTGDPSILANIDRHAMISRSGTVYEALGVLAKSLRSVKGRKSLVLFSAGLREPSEEVTSGGVLLSRSRFYDPAVEALNASNISVYGVNLLENPPNVPVVHQNLQSISADTSGEYFAYNLDFTPAFRKVDQNNAGYYLLAYRSTRNADARDYQKVQVSLRNPEFKVQARQGY
jgi:VWFA-related protein